jgi:hypothetical protein
MCSGSVKCAQSRWRAMRTRTGCSFGGIRPSSARLAQNVTPAGPRREGRLRRRANRHLRQTQMPIDRRYVVSGRPQYDRYAMCGHESVRHDDKAASRFAPKGNDGRSTWL